FSLRVLSRVSLPRRLFNFLSAGIGCAPVSNGRSKDRNVHRQCLLDRFKHLTRAFNFYHFDIWWIGYRDRTAYKRHISAGGGGHSSTTVTLFTRRAISDV